MGQPVVQWQIVAKDPEKAEAFYTGLFGWRINADNPLGYRVVETGSDRGIGGGIWPAGPQGQHSLVQLFIEVDDVERFARKATDLGASVIIPPQTLPGGDQLAIVLDPLGCSFGLYKPAA